MFARLGAARIVVEAAETTRGGAGGDNDEPPAELVPGEEEKEEEDGDGEKKMKRRSKATPSSSKQLLDDEFSYPLWPVLGIAFFSGSLSSRRAGALIGGVSSIGAWPRFGIALKDLGRMVRSFVARMRCRRRQQQQQEKQNENDDIAGSGSGEHVDDMMSMKETCDDDAAGVSIPNDPIDAALIETDAANDGNDNKINNDSKGDEDVAKEDTVVQWWQ